MKDFLLELEEIREEKNLLDFCRRKMLHGTPHVFSNNEDGYYAFRRRIAAEFEVGFHEVFIVGSAKLGFSPRKGKEFDLDSDIDVAIVSEKLFDEIMINIYNYQMQLRENRRAVTDNELKVYHKFLEYCAMGWIRPDKLPTSFRVDELKQNWFDFFNSISHGKSEVGNYQVSAAVFKGYTFLEGYILSDMNTLRIAKQIGASDASAN